MDELKEIAREPEASKEELQKRISDLEQEISSLRQSNQAMAETVIRLSMKLVGTM